MSEPIETRTEWQQFFDGHAPHYLENSFTRNTRAEVDFFLSHYALPARASILDVGCGVGRHAIELARRGYRVLGIDISEGMLEVARMAADSAGVNVEFVHADATAYVAELPCDAAICLCEGAFNLIGSEDDAVTHDLAILKNISASLERGAPFLLTALNGYALIRQLKEDAIQQGSFDPATMVATYKDIWKLPEGAIEMRIKERRYLPPEVAAMLHVAGFQLDHVYGGTAGEWGRRPLKLDEVEAMYVSRRR